MGEILTVAEGLLGLGGGGPLVDTHTDEHQTNTDVGVDVNVSDDHEIGSHNTSIDSHNVTIQQYYSEEHHQEVHSGGGGGGGGGGGHHAHFDPQVYEMQKHLQEEGFNPGALDGLMGPQTQHALMEDEQFEMRQHQHGHHGGETDGEDTSYSVDHHEHYEHHEQHHGHVAPPADDDTEAEY